MRFSSLSESDLGISREEVGDLFAPFVTRRFTESDADWDRELARRRRKIRKKYLKRILLAPLPAWQRRRATVLREYNSAWSKVDYGEYDTSREPPRVAPWIWHGEQMFASDIGATRVRQLLLVRLVERLRPRRVLEVGCGNGINLMLLAGRFPQVELHGAELTHEGPRAARRLQTNERIPQALSDYAPLPLEDPAAFRRVSFVQGDAGQLPFSSGSFDLVYTMLALEQMERLRRRALSEVARVCEGHTLMIEPFRDVNDHGWPRRYVIARNYFRGRIGDLEGFGLRPVLTLDDFPQEAFLKACAVLARKVPAHQPARAGNGA